MKFIFKLVRHLFYIPTYTYIGWKCSTIGFKLSILAAMCDKANGNEKLRAKIVTRYAMLYPHIVKAGKAMYHVDNPGEKQLPERKYYVHWYNSQYDDVKKLWEKIDNKFNQ